MKKTVQSDLAPKALGPYSQAVLDRDTLFLSGQVGIDPGTGQLVSDDVGEQAHRVMKNLVAVLEAAGMSLENVVKTTIYLASMEDFQNVNEIYGKYFVKDPPARATIQVAKLPLGARIEIEAIARK